MSHIFITGSADGLGKANAKTLLSQGHKLIVHVRSESRRAAVQELADQGATVVVADLSDFNQTKKLAEQINKIGTLDAIIHNAGVYSGESLFKVNVIAPYVLTALIHKPKRLVYISSQMHYDGQPDLKFLNQTSDGSEASYSTTKLLVTTLMAAVSKLWPDVICSAVDPGWVPTKMGGPNAPDDLLMGQQTQEWLVTSHETDALVSGQYWHHKTAQKPHPSVYDIKFQNDLLKDLEGISGLKLKKQSNY